MKKIMICGYFGFNNFGDEWLLKNLIYLLKKYGSKKKQIFVLYNLKFIKKIDNFLYYIPRWKLKKVVRFISVVDTVIFCGGVFQDQSSILSFFYYFFILIVAKFFNKKIILLSTEFIINKIPKFFLLYMFKIIDIIYVRNKIEFRKYKNFCKNIYFCPDICFLDYQEDISRKKNENIENVCFIIKDDFKINRFLYNILKNYKLIFIPFHLGQDYKFCLKLVNKFSSCEIRIWDKIENIKEIFYNVDLIIASRLHGIVASINLGIPFICMSKEYKLKSFVFQLDCIKSKKMNNNIEFFTSCVDSIKNYKEIIKERFIFLSNNGYI